MAMSSSRERIPVVDFSNPSRRQIANELDVAFRTAGFCVAVNHAIPRGVSGKLREEAFRFFEQTVEQKCLQANGIMFDSTCGTTTTTYGKACPYTFKSESTAALLGDLTKSPDMVEALSFFDDIQERLAENTNDRESALSADLRREILRYHAALGDFADTLAQLCALAIFGRDEDAQQESLAAAREEDAESFFLEQCHAGAWGLRIAHYLEPEEDVDGDTCDASSSPRLRFSAHVDSYGLTLLEPDPLHHKGLQVLLPRDDRSYIERDALDPLDPLSSGFGTEAAGESAVSDEREGIWVDVPFVQGGLILNIGALLSRWTGNVWKANVHRVVYHPGRRLSLVSAALMPTDDVIIERLRFQSESRRSEGKEYPPIACRDFVRERMQSHNKSQGSASTDAKNEAETAPSL